MRDGTRIVHRIVRGTGGRGTGTGRCVLIHSLAMNGHFWDAVAERLADAAEILVYDCRGHGRSDKPAGPYAAEQFADDLADLMDAVGWSRAVVAGASMGGCIALAFAAAYPERTAGLGLIDTTAWYGPQAPEQWAERGRKGREEGMAALVAFQKTRWFSDGFRDADPAAVERAVAVFLANDPVAYEQTCRMLGAVDKTAALAGIRCPTRILVGAEDYATPVAMATAMRDGMPDATLRVIDGVRHFTPLECPAVIVDELHLLIGRSPL
jgi:3-oxoadipate enol-lactonase